MHYESLRLLMLYFVIFYTFRMIHATPKPTKQLHSSGILDDSMPRSSPSAYRPMVINPYDMCFVMFSYKFVICTKSAR